MVVSRGHDSLPAGVTVSGSPAFSLLLAWMIPAHESRTVDTYRESRSRSPAPTSRSFTNEIAALSLSVPDPRSEGNHHMYNQALILMRCVVVAEEYNMARHALPPTPASSQPVRDSHALDRRTALEQRQRAPRGAKTDHAGVTRT